MTFTIDTSTLVGHLSKDRQSLALAADTPVVETQTFSTGFVQERVCARTRVPFKLKKDDK